MLAVRNVCVIDSVVYEEMKVKNEGRCWGRTENRRTTTTRNLFCRIWVSCTRRTKRIWFEEEMLEVKRFFAVMLRCRCFYGLLCAAIKLWIEGNLNVFQVNLA